MAEDIEVKSFLIAKMNNERYKAMKEQGTLPANSIIFTPGVGGGMSSMPMGTIFASAIPISNPKVHLLDGSTILQEGIYSQFAEHIKSLVATGHSISCTQSEFDTSVTTYGQCGKFVIDNTAGTIRLPKITKFIEGLSDMTKIGSFNKAGLPNITGTFRFIGDSGNAGVDAPATGSDAITPVNGTGSGSNVAGAAWNCGLGFNFDANNGASTKGIYRNDVDTVQPESISYPYYIVLATGYKSTGDIELDNLLNEINSKPTLDEVYPIGSIYITANNHQNPAKIFGGTWERIEDKFLLGAGGSYAGGATGGKTAVTLTTDQIPSHNHQYRVCTSTYWTGEPLLLTQSAGSGNADGATISSQKRTWSGTLAEGGSQSHENMPPYLAVYIYQRVE